MATSQRIPPRYFHDKRVFERERQRIVARTWQFFCLKSALQNDRDFVAESVAGIPLVVQNVHGELRAFHNVCSHRYSPLQNAHAGNRRLHCQYHGWVYDGDGVPTGIPNNAEYFPILPEQKLDLALTQYRVETCGELVFVTLDSPRSLAQQLGDWHPLLMQIGDSLDSIWFHSRFEAQCNWKFMVHSAFDDIHVPFLHGTTFDTSGDSGSTWRTRPYAPGSEDLMQDYSRRHGQLNVRANREAVERNEKEANGVLVDRAHRFDDYLHFYVYPNLLITSVQGLWYNIVRCKPLAPDVSEMACWVIPGRPRCGRSSVTPDVLYQLALGTLRVFDEDVRAFEGSQRGIRSVADPGVLGCREDKIAAFEAAYMDLMSESDA